MSSFSNRKRAPFGGNASNTIGAARRLEPPSSLHLSKAPPRAPISSILVKNKNGAARSGSRSRSTPRARKLEPLEQQSSSSSDDANRARVSAEAYEAKIRIAAQEQRIEALQAELQEIKFFQVVESESKHDSAVEEMEQKREADAELIEALAAELETMEKDFKHSKERVSELEGGLLGRSKSSDNDASVSESIESAQWKEKEAQLKKQLEQKHQQVVNAERDVHAGIKILRDMEVELKKARADRDDARSQLTTLSSEVGRREDDYSERAASMKELEVSLKSIQNGRDQALSGLEVKAKRCEKLEQSNNELQNTLKMVQSQYSKKADEVREGILALKQENELLKESLQEQKNRSESLESSFADLTRECEELKEQLQTKAAALEEVEDLHTITIANLQEEHSIEIEELRKTDSLMDDTADDAVNNNDVSTVIASNMNERHEKEVRKKDDLLKSRESYWANSMNDLKKEVDNARAKTEIWDASETNYVSEIKALKKELERYNNKNVMEGPDDEFILDKLKAEKDDLVRKLESGIDIHKKTTAELKSKTLELNNLQSAGAQIENDSLKRDYAAAVELSIARGKEIKTMDEDVKKYKNQLAKLISKTRKLEKKVQASSGNSCADQLESDLANSRKANEESQAKIANLEEAVGDTQSALKALTTQNMSPRKQQGSSSSDTEEKRREIEGKALQEYYKQRMDS